MTPREILVIAIKTFLLIILLQIILIQPSYIVAWFRVTNPVDNPSITLLTGAIILFLLIATITCVLLWQFSNKLLQDSNEKTPLFDFSASKDFTEIIILLLGVFLLINELLLVINGLTRIIYTRIVYTNVNYLNYSGYDIAVFAIHLFTLVLLATMVRYPAGWKKMLLRIAKIDKLS